MSLHVPLAPEAILESYMLMLSIHNIRSPAHGRALMAPTQDVVIGLYYLTKEKVDSGQKALLFSSVEEIEMALTNRTVELHAPVKYECKNKIIDTTAGRVIFNNLLPEEMQFKNQSVNKRILEGIVDECLEKFGTEKAIELLDSMKRVGFEYATRSGLTIGIDDMVSPKIKEKIWQKGTREVMEINRAHKNGLISETERYNKIIDTWTRVAMDIEENLLEGLESDEDGFNPLFMMVHSGARGSRNQACQICGLRGLMSKPQRKVTSVQIGRCRRIVRQSLDEYLSELIEGAA